MTCHQRMALLEVGLKLVSEWLYYCPFLLGGLRNCIICESMKVLRSGGFRLKDVGIPFGGV